MRLAYRKANALLNQHISNISDGQTSFHIHYWGFMPNHYNNSLHRHSFLKSVMSSKEPALTRMTMRSTLWSQEPCSARVRASGTRSAVSRGWSCSSLPLKSTRP